MVVAESALHLLFRAIALEFAGMSTSALALAVGLVPLVARLFPAYQRGKWPAVKTEVWKDALWGLLTSLSVWVLLFFWFFAMAVYQDHRGLAKRAGELHNKVLLDKQTSDTTLAATQNRLGSEINTLRTDCAVKDGIDQTLQKQNRDEQVLIAGCQSQALKLLTPEQEKMTVLSF